MSDPSDVRIDRLDAPALLRALAALDPQQITLTGWAGAGYSLVTDLLGPGVYAGVLPLPWTTDVLVVMHQTLTGDGAAMLTGLGVAAPRDELRSLRIGEGLLLRRAAAAVPLPGAGCAACGADARQWCALDCAGPAPMLAPEHRAGRPVPVPPFGARTEAA